MNRKNLPGPAKETNLPATDLIGFFFSSWEERGCFIRQETLPRMTFDYCPILLDSNALVQGPVPFKYGKCSSHSDKKKKIINSSIGFKLDGMHSMIKVLKTCLYEN